MIHVVHPMGNSFVRALLEALQKEGNEFEFWTTVSCRETHALGFLPAITRSQLERRTYPIPASRIHTRPFRESLRLLAPIFGLKHLSRHEFGWASVDAIFRDLDCSVARYLRSNRDVIESDSWVYGYEDGALETFLAANEMGMKRAYELPIAYWETSRRLLKDEAERWPEWEGTLVGPVDSAAKLERKTKELELANVIVVPSRFVQRSLPAWLKPEQRVVVAEFGSPGRGKAETEKLKAERGQMKGEGGKRKAETDGKGRLRVLFAGSMTQRKGLADVFEAMRLLNRSDVELVVMGSPVLSLNFYRAQGIAFTYEPTRPHAAVLELMRACDVLVLPSIVEGRALVQQEALACGLPIIVTANAGGEDLVIEGETGFLVPIRLPQAIADKISWLGDHRDHLETMRPFCRTKAAAYTWQRYASTILGALGLTH